MPAPTRFPFHGPAPWTYRSVCARGAWTVANGVLLALVLTSSGCSRPGEGAAEPAEAESTATKPAGEVVPVGNAPEGVVFDPTTRLVVVSSRNPNAIELVDGRTGHAVRTLSLPSAARHLQLAAPGGPVLVPAERADELVKVGLSDGEIASRTKVGKFPHDAAQYDGRSFVTNEFGDTISVVEGDRLVSTLEAPEQPGGVAVSVAASIVGVLGVRDHTLEFYDAQSLRSLGRVDAGEGPTHQVAGPGDRFYVVDTREGALLVFAAHPKPVLLERVSLPGSPYGLAIDPRRERLWVTLTATNRVALYDVSDGVPRWLADYPTVRQPNSVAVDPITGRVFVPGVKDGVLQLLDPP